MIKRLFQLVLSTLFLTTSVLAANAPTPSAPAAPASIAAPTTATPAAPVAEVPVPTAPMLSPVAADKQPMIIPTAPNLGSTGYVLMDADTGMIIAHKGMHQKMQPASLTKLMTLYLTFNALKNGQIHLTDQVRVSKRAWQTGGSRMFIKENSLVSVQDLIDGIIVASGNDACVALSQYVGGNEATFVNMMNAEAQQLGMKDTHYIDSTGLPQPGHHTTPYDMASKIFHNIIRSLNKAGLPITVSNNPIAIVYCGATQQLTD